MILTLPRLNRWIKEFFFFFGAYIKDREKLGLR